MNVIVVRTLLAVLGALVGLLVVEGGVRLQAGYEARQKAQAWQAMHEGRVRRSTGPLQLAHVLRISENPDIIYELLPDLSGGAFEGQVLDTNRHGFRGPDYTEQPEPGVLRIVGLGDSVMFGWGVPQDESFPSVLQRRLNQRNADRRYEVINTAVPGYNTTMEVATLESKGLAFDPSLVLVHFVANDFSLPNFIPARRGNEFSALNRSFLLERLVAMVAEEEVPRGAFGPQGLRRAPRGAGPGQFEDDPSRVPSEYRHMVGPDSYRSAMQRLARLRDEHGFEVLVTFPGESVPEVVSSVCEELGFPMLGVFPVVDRYMKEHDIASWRGSEMTISPEDGHPSAIWHRLMAETIHEYLTESCLLPLDACRGRAPRNAHPGQVP